MCGKEQGLWRRRKRRNIEGKRLLLYSRAEIKYLAAQAVIKEIFIEHELQVWCYSRHVDERKKGPYPYEAFILAEGD